MILKDLTPLFLQAERRKKCAGRLARWARHCVAHHSRTMGFLVSAHPKALTGN